MFLNTLTLKKNAILVYACVLLHLPCVRFLNASLTAPSTLPTISTSITWSDETKRFRTPFTNRFDTFCSSSFVQFFNLTRIEQFSETHVTLYDKTTTQVLLTIKTLYELKELEHTKLGWKVLILKYDLGKSLRKEMWYKMADTKKFLDYIFLKMKNACYMK